MAEDVLNDTALLTTRFSRRRIAQGAAAGSLALALGSKTSHAQSDSATPVAGTVLKPQIGMSPRPGSKTAAPGTTIAFRGVNQDQLGPIAVTGSAAGAVSGVLVNHLDGMGVSFLPDTVFEAGETVTVETAVPFANGSTTATFTIGQHISHLELPTERDTSNPETNPLTFVSRPDLRPAAVEKPETTSQSTVQHVMLTPNVNDGQAGPMIVDKDGKLV